MQTQHLTRFQHGRGVWPRGRRTAIPVLDLSDLPHSEQRAALDELAAHGTIVGVRLPAGVALEFTDRAGPLTPGRPPAVASGGADAVIKADYRMYRNGKSLSWIAARRGVSPQAIWKAFKSRGLRLRAQGTRAVAF